jgi:hypothetical protein
MIPLQEKVDDIVVIIAGQVRKRGFEFEAIPDHAAVHLLRLRHALVTDHLIEFGHAHANVSGGFFT